MASEGGVGLEACKIFSWKISANSMNIIGNVTKILLASFQKHFKALVALGSCHVTSSRQGVN